MLLYARLNGFVEAGAAAESSWTEFAHRKEDSWERNDCSAGADMMSSSDGLGCYMEDDGENDVVKNESCVVLRKTGGDGATGGGTCSAAENGARSDDAIAGVDRGNHRRRLSKCHCCPLTFLGCSTTHNAHITTSRSRRRRCSPRIGINVPHPHPSLPLPRALLARILPVDTRPCARPHGRSSAGGLLTSSWRCAWRSG